VEMANSRSLSSFSSLSCLQNAEIVILDSFPLFHSLIPSTSDPQIQNEN
jgi:hypothetical protein